VSSELRANGIFGHAVTDQRMIDATVALWHYIQTVIHRIAAQPVVEQLYLPDITRRLTPGLPPWSFTACREPAWRSSVSVPCAP
jgi:hypothetical protein